MGAGKTVLIVVGAVMGTCCLGTVFLGLSCYRSAKGTMAEAETYAQGAIRKIGKDWSYDALASEGNDLLLQSTPRDKAGELFKEFRAKLGSVTDVGPISVSSLNTNSSFHGPTTEVVGTLPVRFEKDSGLAKVTLVKGNDTWKIQELRIDAPKLHSP